MELNPIISNESNQAKNFFAKYSRETQTMIIQIDNMGIHMVALEIKEINNCIIIESAATPQEALIALKEILPAKFADKIVLSAPIGGEKDVVGFSIYLPMLPSKEWRTFLKNKQVVFNPTTKVNKNGEKIENIYILDPHPILVGFRCVK